MGRRGPIAISSVGHSRLITENTRANVLIAGINFPDILDSPSQLMFVFFCLWRHIFFKDAFTLHLYSSDDLYLYVLHSYRDYACDEFHLYFTLSTHFSFMCIYIFAIIMLFCLVLRYHWCSRLCIYVLCILYTAPKNIVVRRFINW